MSSSKILFYIYMLCCSVPKSCPTLYNPMDCSTPGFPVLHYFPEFAQIHVHWIVVIFNHLIFCHPLLLLPSIFPSIRVFSKPALCIRWPKYWSFIISLPVNIWGWFSLGLTGLISLLSKGLSRIFSSTTIRRHQFFGTQPSLWSNCHIHTWLLGKP